MESKNSARERALDTLEEWCKRGTSLDLIVESKLAAPFNDPRDYQLCRALIYGVVRWLGYLDAVLANYSKHPLSKMKPLTRQSFRLGLYQLLFMDRIPASAAINETIKILKKRNQPRWLTGFVNGLLRRVSREKPTISEVVKKADKKYQKHELLSHPKWLYKRWSSRYGSGRTETLCTVNNREADLCLRLIGISPNDFINKLAEKGIKAEQGRYSEEAVILPEYRGAITELPGYQAGMFLIQDQAAQLAGGLLGGSLENGNYMDGCAGLGGKTSLLALKLKKDASLLAVEPNQKRFELLSVNLKRLGFDKKVKTFRGNLEDIDARDVKYKGILIDAPCSGLGVIRRHPDIRWNRKEADLQEYQSQQLSLLNQAARLLAPEGVLVYLTCSTEPEENEQVIEIFLADHPDFKIENCSNYLPEQAKGLVDRQGFFHPLPDQGLDGFFGARLVKKAAE